MATGLSVTTCRSSCSPGSSWPPAPGAGVQFGDRLLIQTASIRWLTGHLSPSAGSQLTGDRYVYAGRVGLLDRLIDGINLVARPFQGLSTPTDPRLKRGARVERKGAAGTATIVGIRRGYRQDATHTTFALQVDGSPSRGASRFGTEVTTTPHLHRLRLGLSVPVRIDGERGVIDWSTLATTWGLSGDAPGQRPQRDAPPDGIDERSLTDPERKLLEGGRRTTVTLVGLERVYVLGMPTLNWDVQVRLEDGVSTTVKADEVPPYAWWIARPGAVLPVVVNPADATKLAIDWAEATTAATSNSRIDLHDRPPEGSIAAMVAASAPAPATTMQAAPAEPIVSIATHRNEAMVTGTLREWVGEVKAGRMKPKAFLKYVAEWERSGLCTPQEAAAARAAAGLEA